MYQTGLNILKLYPLPNHNVPGDAYNYEIIRPVESALGWQPALRVDYQPWPTLRGTFKYSGWAMRNQTFNGSLPGFNDSRQQNPKVSTWAVTINHTFSTKTFLEGTWTQPERAGRLRARPAGPARPSARRRSR